MRLPVFVLTLALIPAAVMAQMPTGPMPNGKLPPGHPNTGQAQPAPPAAEMTNSGVVQETIAASPYVYIRAQQIGGEIWLAAPAIELKTGQTIRWPDGMVMNKFFSKTLNRTFDTVYFVSVVQPQN
ncbi:MAG TPA: hypothetical protein HPQ04_07475 [Rhodospirillaceae bacterium]|nr:hypothetical protein [Rhodospirillaceae bacterium]